MSDTCLAPGCPLPRDLGARIEAFEALKEYGVIWCVYGIQKSTDAL